MKNIFLDAPVQSKIFGLALGILSLLFVSIYISYTRLRQVNQEITNLAEYTIPITDLVADVNIHALEQELHFQRAIKLAEIEPLDQIAIASEINSFEDKGKIVDRQLAKAMNLAQVAIAQSQQQDIQEKLIRLEPMLEQIEAEHQDFHDHIAKVFQLLEARDKDNARELEKVLIKEQSQFNKEVETIFLELEEFMVLAAQSSQKNQQTLLQLVLLVTLIAICFGVLASSAITRSLTEPTRYLTKKMKAIGQGNLDVEMDVTSGDEIGYLTASFNQMVTELKQKEQIKATFGKYVDPRVVEKLMHSSEGANTGGQRQVMTVFFADICGLSKVTKNLSPHELVKATNQYLTLMSAPISDYSGVIDKFIGTTIMGFWGPPFTNPEDHSKLACQAALEQIGRLATLEQILKQVIGKKKALTTLPKLNLNVGIATGPLVVGNMGSESAKSYTVMGDTVNLASRLKGASKQYGVQVLLSEEAQVLSKDVVETREIDAIQVVGKEEAIRVYELLSSKGALPENLASLRDVFSQGLTAYRARNWQQAQLYFQQCLQIKADDNSSTLSR